MQQNIQSMLLHHCLVSFLQAFVVIAELFPGRQNQTDGVIGNASLIISFLGVQIRRPNFSLHFKDKPLSPSLCRINHNTNTKTLCSPHHTISLCLPPPISNHQQCHQPSFGPETFENDPMANDGTWSPPANTSAETKDLTIYQPTFVGEMRSPSPKTLECERDGVMEDVEHDEWVVDKIRGVDAQAPIIDLTEASRPALKFVIMLDPLHTKFNQTWRYGAGRATPLKIKIKVTGGRKDEEGGHKDEEGGHKDEEGGHSDEDDDSLVPVPETLKVLVKGILRSGKRPGGTGQLDRKDFHRTAPGHFDKETHLLKGSSPLWPFYGDARLLPTSTWEYITYPDSVLGLDSAGRPVY